MVPIKGPAVPVSDDAIIVSNNMLTDIRDKVQENSKTTILDIDQNSSGVKVQYIVSLQ